MGHRVEQPTVKVEGRPQAASMAGKWYGSQAMATRRAPGPSEGDGLLPSNKGLGGGGKTSGTLFEPEGETSLGVSRCFRADGWPCRLAVSSVSAISQSGAGASAHKSQGECASSHV